MLRDIIPFLVCPHCGADLAPAEGGLQCGNRHRFDIARQGYVSLLTGREHALRGDTAAMVEAREAFLQAGHYEPIGAALLAQAERALPQAPVECMADLGAGTGYYLTRLLQAADGAAGIALDISKYALRRAARAHPRIGAAACDVWGPLPIRSASLALVLSLFAPRNPVEIRRILRPDGALIVVSPTERHLRELVTELGLLSVDERKRQRLDEQMSPYFQPPDTILEEFTLSLGHSEIETLVAMGPNAWHADRTGLKAAVGELPTPLAVTASVAVATYRPR